MRAGEYSTRLTWLKQESAGPPDTFGQKFKDNPNQGYLWGSVEDVVAGRETKKESNRMTVTAVIRLRNYPAVRPGDKLRDAGRGDVWEVLTAVKLDNEVYCEVER